MTSFSDSTNLHTRNSSQTSLGSSSAVHHHHHHHHYYHYGNPSGTLNNANNSNLNSSSSDININRVENDNNDNLDGTTENIILNSSNVSNNTNSNNNNNNNNNKKKSLPFMKVYASMKTLSLSHLTAKQHLLMAICRDFSLLLPIIYFCNSLKKAWEVSSNSKKSIHIYDIQSITEMLSLLWQTYMVNNDSNNKSSSSFSSSSSSTTHLSSPVSNTLNRLGKDLGRENLVLDSITRASSSEYILCALWCLVSLYLTYSILDSLMVRWIVKYSTVAAILRMFSMSILLVTLELVLLSSFSPQSDYYLHTWILISCILTAAFIWQSYLSSNLNYVSEDDDDEEDELILRKYDGRAYRVNNNSAESTIRPTSSDSVSTDNSTMTSRERKRRKKSLKSFKFTKKRTIDLYNITVFCVVPVGLASFITMVGLLRNLFIQRLDVEQITLLIQNSYRS
ncbi:hypothetical protein Kpol_1020p34 [Vanderwaltozyma polyspora DSM 70294]|uniref:N-glycosylation protein EOS1 n=1 Tax=Vanderwaltozyma polyspora (strain ATCC 22028 / DSM 70294 / BCRC 21397 / CBS 2163 / NBRC 10782 / NRRL Y-8283 / UCD 57-17) TaxID=436907 RepID=A7TLE4_VANPO|nr:uncharacterized protein Kpol_1020p34 [Vanderwaltozyma polyspora DSM 70294]EDO16925.1 hypothetical protein Kpol_1020p34 [Vanderwaltozyma polyspora DSM 70294]